MGPGRAPQARGATPEGADNQDEVGGEGGEDGALRGRAERGRGEQAVEEGPAPAHGCTSSG